MMYFFVGHDKIMYMYNLCKCTCGRVLCLEYRVSWVRVPLFLGKVTALGVLCCFALFVCLTLLASFFLPSHLSFKNMYILGLVWCHWWFHYPGLLLHTELMASQFIRCTMRCEIWAQPAKLPR